MSLVSSSLKFDGLTATFTLLRFRFYPFSLMKMLSVHISPFSNEYAMKTIGVHTAPANDVGNPLLKTMPFVSSCQESAIREFECHNAIVFNSLSTKECEAF